MNTLRFFALAPLLLVACASSEPGEDGAASGDEGGDVASTQTAALTAVTGFGSNPGALALYEYAPVNVPANAPLVVVMHGCTQSAADYAKAGWNQLADKYGFYVAYPEQNSSNNQNKCFNWFQTQDITRGQGEAASIAQMVTAMKGRHSVDASRVFVTGLSAGAAMTSVMLAAYPDVFAAGAIMSGLPYKCATSMVDAFSCMNPGKDQTPAQWSSLAKGGFAGYTGSYPRVSVWHSSSDTTVGPKNETEIVDQWTGVHGISQTPNQTETVDGAKHATYADALGNVQVESWLIPGMSHGTAVDPGNAEAGGCGQAGAYILDVGVCSTLYAGKFFGLTGDDVPAPPAGGSSSGGSSSGGTTPTEPEQPEEPSTCVDHADTNWGHVQAGRATRCGAYNSYVCAVGSGTQFGLWNLLRTNLKETAPGFFEVGTCN